jgi:hypothetical protein
MSNRSNRPKNTAHRRGSGRQQDPSKAKALYELQPGGLLYHDWWDVRSVQHAEEWAHAVTSRTDIGADERQLVERAPYFAGIYGRWVPILAAMTLDECIEDGEFAVMKEGDASLVRSMYVSEFVGLEAHGEGTARDVLHRLHAKGVILMDLGGIVALATPWYLKERARRVAAGKLD